MENSGEFPVSAAKQEDEVIEIPSLLTVISSKEIQGFDTTEGIDKIADNRVSLFK